MMLNKTLRGFIRKELTQALRDPKMRAIIFVLPLVQMMVFGLAISTEVKNIKLGAVYRPNDTLAVQTVSRAIGSGWFVQAKASDVDYADPFQWVRSGRADAVLVAPPETLTSAIGRGQGRIQLLINASNVLLAQNAENYLKAILTGVVLDPRTVTPLAASSAGAGAPAAGPARPLAIDARVLYNPSLESPVFLVPGVMSMILCLVTILLTSMAIAREKEMGTFEMIISAPVKTSEILLGKTLPFILLGLVDVPLVLAVAVLGFKVPMRGSFAVLALATSTFVITTVSIGTLISTIAKNQQQAMMGSFIFLFVAILLSGIMFPVESMPIYIKVFAYLDPLKYFVTLLRNIMLKGGAAEVVWPNLGVLAAVAIGTASYSFKRFKARLT